MGRPLDITFEVQADEDGRGAPPKWAALQLRHVFDERIGQKTRVRIGGPVRTRPQDRLYFEYMGRISQYFLEAGVMMSKDDCHEHFKERYLPIVRSSIFQASGETVDIGPVRRKPNGEERTEYSITGLTVEAMSLYIECVAADPDVLAMRVPFPTDEAVPA